jgi:hypothetical protein
MGCGSQQQALDLNNSVAKGTKRLEQAGLEFGKAAGEALARNDPKHAAEARKQYENTMALLGKTMQEANALKVDGIAGGAEFRDAYIKFLQTEESLMKKEFKDVVEILEDQKLERAQRKQRFDETLQRVTRAEEPALSALKSAQKTFASKHNFKVQ